MAAWNGSHIFAFSEARPPACYHRIRLSLPLTLTKNVGLGGVRREAGTPPHPDPRLGHGEMHRSRLYLMGPPNEKDA